MKKHVKYRERLFAMLAELLLDPGPYKIKETALRYGVSDKQVRNDIDYLREKLNTPNQREYISRYHGKYEGNFSRGIVNLSPKVRLYLFLALKQVEPLLLNEGQEAYKLLFQHACSVLPKQDIERMKSWSKFYRIKQFGYPKERIHFYQALNEVFDAILYNQIIRFRYKKAIRYFDPYMVYYCKNNFYIIGKATTPSGEEIKKQRIKHYRLDRLLEVKKVWIRSPIANKVKAKEVLNYKESYADAYIDQMFEAENNNNQREDYIINILEQNAFQRIGEKEWHPRQEIKLIGQMIQGKYVVGQIKFPNVASPMELKKWVLGWGSALEVVAPRHFKEEIQKEIKILFDQVYRLSVFNR
ncbi:helix-turn-helix transcriptional regulator [Laceyella sediminis]|nr:WYL domain-containing protein [Laceyella sediminis]